MVDIEILKDVFFFIGSILGIVAFISSALNPLLEANQEKWKRVLSHFDDDFFQNLESLYVTRSIKKTDLYKLWHFLDEIREDKDYLRLKFPNRRLFTKHLNNFKKIMAELDGEIKHPIWDDEFPPSNKGDHYTLSKIYFRENFDHHEIETTEYLKHLNNTTDLVIKLRIEFRAMQTIANLNFIEILIKRLLVRQSTKKLKKRIGL